MTDRTALSERWRQLFKGNKAFTGVVPSTRARSLMLTAVELLALALWTLVIARQYLNLDPDVVPIGREYLTAIYAHFMWDDVKACGVCAMWYGHARGGYPAFVDPHESMLHPVVIAATLIWGTLNGAKMALVAFFFLGGIAQWWTARVMGLGVVARVWTGGIAIAAGNLSGRMENGIFPLVVSSVSCAFMLPPILLLARDGSRRSAALLGIAIGMLLLSGQAYLQIGFALLSPLILILFAHTRFGLRQLVVRFGLALGIGLMIAAPLLVPFLHFSPNFGKFVDSSFADAQPARYAPLNLVMADPGFYLAGRLGMQPYPYLYTIFIGWIAVIFAVIGLTALWLKRQRRLALFLALFVAGAFFVGGATPFRWIRDLTEDQSSLHQFIIGIRHPTIMTGLTVPALLALAAHGIDAVMRR